MEMHQLSGLCQLLVMGEIKVAFPFWSGNKDVARLDRRNLRRLQRCPLPCSHLSLFPLSWCGGLKRGVYSDSYARLKKSPCNESVRRNPCESRRIFRPIKLEHTKGDNS